jgi:hypothetical protein
MGIHAWMSQKVPPLSAHIRIERAGISCILLVVVTCYDSGCSLNVICLVDALALDSKVEGLAT